LREELHIQKILAKVMTQDGLEQLKEAINHTQKLQQQADLIRDNEKDAAAPVTKKHQKRSEHAFP